MSLRTAAGLLLWLLLATTTGSSGVSYCCSFCHKLDQRLASLEKRHEATKQATWDGFKARNDQIAELLTAVDTITKNQAAIVKRLDQIEAKQKGAVSAAELVEMKAELKRVREKLKVVDCLLVETGSQRWTLEEVQDNGYKVVLHISEGS